MKVLQIITELQLGGAQKATLNLAQWLKSKNYDLILISSARGILVQEAKHILGVRFKELKFLKRNINPIYDLIAFFSLYIFIKDNKFDIVHTHSSKAGILGRWAAYFCFYPKIIHTAHGFAFHDYQNWVVKRFYILFEKITAVISNKIIAVSEEVKAKGLKHKIGSTNKYAVVYELVDIKSYSTKLTSKNKNFKIGMVGALKYQKAPQDFVKAAWILNKNRDDLKFLLVGNGKLKSDLEKLVKKYNLVNNFKFLGWRRDIEKIMSEFDILVLPSLFEGQPHVIIEALALGIPVVASDVDGIKDLIKDGENGFLVKPHSPYQIADKVNKLLNDKQLRAKVARNAQRYFFHEKKLDYLSNLDKIEQIYCEVMK